MTSNWKNRWLALALATTMTATTVSAPLTYAADSMQLEEIKDLILESNSTVESSGTAESSSTVESSSVIEDIAQDKQEVVVLEGQWNPKSVWKDGFEDTITSTNGNVQKYWKNGLVPTNWNSIWVAKAPSSPEKMYFEVATDTKTEGKNSVHLHSEDSAGRLAVIATFSGLDYSKNYILQMKIKHQDVAGTGFYARAQVGEKGNKAVAIGSKIKGTSDWTTYQIPLKDLAQTAEDNSGVMKLEVFAEYMTSDIWVDQIEVKVSVSDPDKEEIYYKAMRENWTERLTGNSYWTGDSTSEEYKKILLDQDAKVDEILKTFVADDANQLFNDLKLVSPTQPKKQQL